MSSSINQSVGRSVGQSENFHASVCTQEIYAILHPRCH